MIHFVFKGRSTPLVLDGGMSNVLCSLDVSVDDPLWTARLLALSRFEC